MVKVMRRGSLKNHNGQYDLENGNSESSLRASLNSCIVFVIHSVCGS